jgi:hypothetical protein
MAIGLNDLKKHLVPPVKPEPQNAPAVEPPVAREVPTYSVRGFEERQIYSVRTILQNISAQAAAGEAPAELVPNASSDNSGEDQMPSSSPAKGLSDAVLSYVERTGSNEYQVFQAVSKAFDQTRDTRDRLAELTTIYEPIEMLGRSVGEVFASLEIFRAQLDQLAKTFEPVRGFYQQVSKLAQSSEALRPLEEQVGQLARAFHVHLTLLINALRPVEELRMRILQLGEAFEPVTTFQEKFGQLLEAFVMSPEDSAADPHAGESVAVEMAVCNTPARPNVALVKGPEIAAAG